MRGNAVSAFLFAAMLMLHTIAAGSTLRGEIEARFNYYEKAQLFADQSHQRTHYSLATTLDYTGQISRDIEADISIFGRYYPEADKVRQGDIRELRLSYYNLPVEIYAGILMERWGVLEAFSPLEILNPRDRVENFRGDIKLGIPGGKISYLHDSGKIAMWLLPYGREARLAEGTDRFRTSAFAFSDGVFEEGQNALSSAIRISQILDTVEFSLSYYKGHARSPYFTANLDEVGTITLQPYYAQIEQAGFELLWIKGQLLVKLESIYSSSDSGDFIGFGTGMEYEFPRFGLGKTSLTLYGEYYYDNRELARNFSLTAFQNDIFLGLRLARNNLSSTEYQVRFTHDLENYSIVWDLRAKTRIKQQWFIEAILDKFVHVNQDPALTSFASDSRVTVNVVLGF